MHDTVKSKIENLIDKHDVVLFMKGTSKMPQCGFSSRVAGILNYLQVNFKDINVLEDDNFRQGIKDFTDWPTIPQLYIKKEFIGGCDIIQEMYKSGELAKVLESKNIAFEKKK